MNLELSVILMFNMSLHPVVFVTLILSQILSSFADLTELWSTEQLTDIILSDAYGSTIPALSPVIIALYETPCKDRLYREIGFTDRNFPNGMHLQFAVFDRLQAQRKPWYQWHPEVMDIFYFYNISTDSDYINWCPTIIYQPANFSFLLTIYDSNKDGAFNNWVWTMLTIENTQFTNTLENEPVTLLIRYTNPNSNTNELPIINEQILAVVAPKTTVNLENLHVGDIIIAMNKDGQFSDFCVLIVLSFSILKSGLTFFC